MKAEHCIKDGSDFEFETFKKKKKTSKREWAIVVDNVPLNAGEDGGGRKIPNIDDLMLLSMSVKAKLLKIEIIALVLYTGPMVSANHSSNILQYTNNTIQFLNEFESRIVCCIDTSSVSCTVYGI
jgi:hypothetical protein